MLLSVLLSEPLTRSWKYKLNWKMPPIPSRLRLHQVDPGNEPASHSGWRMEDEGPPPTPLWAHFYIKIWEVGNYFQCTLQRTSEVLALTIDPVISIIMSSNER